MRCSRIACALPTLPSLPERPGLIWNGEGGSCGFGHIHMTQAIIDLAREGGAPSSRNSRDTIRGARASGVGSYAGNGRVSLKPVYRCSIAMRWPG